MSAYKRANWKSGLTYEQECPLCKTKVVYTDVKLGFRPWYPDGFVYCPTCQKPLRHSERLAIDTPATEKVASSGGFCTNCGASLKADDNFCSKCGAPRKQG